MVNEIQEDRANMDDPSRQFSGRSTQDIESTRFRQSPLAVDNSKRNHLSAWIWYLDAHFEKEWRSTVDKSLGS